MLPRLKRCPECRNKAVYRLVIGRDRIRSEILCERCGRTVGINGFVYNHPKIVKEMARRWNRNRKGACYDD